MDLIHQLNPVVPGMGLLLADSGLPILLGPLPPRIPEHWEDVETQSGKPNPTFSQRIRDWVLRRQLLDATLILIPTQKSLEQIPVCPTIRQKVRTLHYGVDTSRFLPQSTRSSGPLSILFLSNLLRRKGIFLLLEAFERIASNYPDCILRFAGSGPDEAELRARAVGPLSSRIEFLGNVPPEHVPAVLNACTVFCLPSYCEPFGMAALEAMSCGKPVIGTRSGGLGLLLDDVGARRVKPGDAIDLAYGLAELLSSPSLRSEMGAHNRRRVLSAFSWDKVLDSLEKNYQEVVGKLKCPHPCYEPIS
jgi:glycosyltransferase involved in cell wall biosynthesis